MAFSSSPPVSDRAFLQSIIPAPVLARRSATALAVIVVLSFQGPEGGLTFPLRGLSLHWFRELAQGLGVVDIGAALRRSMGLGVAVMVLTIVLSVMAGLAFRRRLPGGSLLFYVVVASLIMPSIIVSLGIGLEFRLLDTALRSTFEALGWQGALDGFGTSLGLYTSALGAHLTWTLPFGLLIMFAIFNRFNPAYEEELTRRGLRVSGRSPDGKFVEVLELDDHPWFVAVQFHPEFRSKPLRPHPLFADFVTAVVAHAVAAGAPAQSVAG